MKPAANKTEHRSLQDSSIKERQTRGKMVRKEKSKPGANKMNMKRDIIKKRKST